MVKVGIIGFGYMGNFHLNKFEKMDGVKVVSAYDIDEDRLSDARESKLDAYDDLEKFLRSEIDLVVIATPNDVHAELSMAALNAGKHVLCEKPATMTVQELEDVLACAKKNDRIFTTHQNRRWDKDYLVVKEIVENKAIGDLTTIESKTFGQRGVCFGWRADPEKGGGMLYDWGIHLVDQLLMLFPNQKVISIYARLRSILTPIVDDYFELELEFENDVVAHISVGTFALQEQPRWFVFGDKGTLKLDDFSGTIGGAAKIKDVVRGFNRVKKSANLGPSRTMAHLEKESIETLELPQTKEQTFTFHQNLLDAIGGSASTFVTHEQMIRDMKVIEAAFESSEKQEKLRVCI